MSTEKSKNFFEIYISAFLLVLLAGIPAAEIIVRKFMHVGIKGGYDYTRHIVLWLTLLGAALNSHFDGHLKIEFGTKFLSEKYQSMARSFSLMTVLWVCTCFMIISSSFVVMGFSAADKIGVISTRVAVGILPVGFLLVIYRELDSSAGKCVLPWIFAPLGIILGLAVSVSPLVNLVSCYCSNIPEFYWNLADRSIAIISALKLPGLIFLILAGIMGTPIFAVIGGIAFILISASGCYAETAANEFYTMLISNTVPAIPLFTLTGFVLSESKAGDRLIRTFNAFFGWLPGGIILASVLISAFFTVFTGASGVTILALGGILTVVLEKSGIDERYRTGLLCSAGSIGLLFPPSLPIILYGIIAQLDIRQLFIGGIIPGILLVLSLAVTGFIYVSRHDVKAVRSSCKECAASFIECIWEILLPFIIIISYFSGLTTLVETGAVAVLYTMFVDFIIKRELHLKDLFIIARKSVPIIAGILMILGMAKVLSYYMIDQQIPQRFSEWIAMHIHSRIVFLLLLNVALLVVGCFMDIFSAIMVVVPLILPLGELFGVNPVHLGIIFLANLELGYITPPVGLNLFLASYRFDQKLENIYRAVVPFFLIMLLTVFIITYVPQFTLCLIR
ncbi:MAG: TRAP transporter large permease subunit [Spirochaetia bacterium]|nr:TRAP transporter large permease subunit [Spirochaetia bacterium]